MKFHKYGAALLMSAAFIMPQASSAAVTVDLELALLVDVSGSVDTAQFDLQRQGYVDAFNSAPLQAAFASGRTAAVTFIYWSGSAQQQQTVGWTLINSAASSAAFATAIGAAARPFSGQTAIGAALAFTAPLFASNAFDSARQVIDVSGDGVTNDGIASSAGRTLALAAGVDQINGLPIGGGATLLAHYQTQVQGGAGSFTIPAASFADFSAAVQQKVGREIINPGIPEPGTWAMMLVGFGLAGSAMRYRRRKTSVSFAM